MGGGKATDQLPPEMEAEADEDTLTSTDSSTRSPSPVRDPASDEAASLRHWRSKTYQKVLSSYETTTLPPHALQDAKDTITRHRPGDWIEHVGGGTATTDYQLPNIFTLLLVGPGGSGKSTLINRITRVFDSPTDPLAPDRAQVSYSFRPTTPGSCFLQEYIIPRRNSTTSFCIYDTRGLSPVPDDNFKLLQRWMNYGVGHGDMIIRDSDDAATVRRIKDMALHGGCVHPCKKRMVNLVIFVVDGVSVLKSMNSGDAQYNDMVAKTFNYPFLSFKDNKPIVVITHGDELSLTDRARVCTHLGELFGIPPTQQIFDIPDTGDYVTELTIVRMLRYSIEHANRNIPCKWNHLQEGWMMLLRLMDRSEGFESVIVWKLSLEVLIICLCIVYLLCRVYAS